MQIFILVVLAVLVEGYIVAQHIVHLKIQFLCNFNNLPYNFKHAPKQLELAATLKFNCLPFFLT